MPIVRPRATTSGALAILLLGAAATACSDSDPVTPIDEPFSTLTVDASSDWAFIRLGENATEIQVGDPGSSDDWDLGFFATSVMLNGGAAGPSQVDGYCLCQNESATDQQVLGMTAESERPAFEGVTAADIPAEPRAWESDVLAPAIHGWWSYDMSTHTVMPAPDQAWIVRAADGTSYAKLRVAGFEGATQQSAGSVTLEFAFQPGTGEPYGPTQSLIVDVSSGPVYVDLLDGAVSDADDWDLRLEGYTIQLNGGVSGSGQAAAVDARTDFENVPKADEVQASAFASDRFGGVFVAHPWYRYDLQGNHQIWPNYNVYLIRTGDQVYKVQVTSYYRANDGKDRHITFRYAPLAD